MVAIDGLLAADLRVLESVRFLLCDEQFDILAKGAPWSPRSAPPDAGVPFLGLGRCPRPVADATAIVVGAVVAMVVTGLVDRRRALGR
jgi:hypothetical protein